MPCYGPELTAEEKIQIWERRLRHDSPTADAFCDLCQELETMAIDIEKVSPKAYAWWREHKDRDQQRLMKEAAERKTEADREALLAGLTPYEKSLLGIKG